MFSAVQENVGLERVTPARENSERRCGQKDLSGIDAGRLQNHLQCSRRKTRSAAHLFEKNGRGEWSRDFGMNHFSFEVVGASGFEPPTSWSRTREAETPKPCGCRTYEPRHPKILPKLVHLVHKFSAASNYVSLKGVRICGRGPLLSAPAAQESVSDRIRKGILMRQPPFWKPQGRDVSGTEEPFDTGRSRFFGRGFGTQDEREGSGFRQQGFNFEAKRGQVGLQDVPNQTF